MSMPGGSRVYPGWLQVAATVAGTALNFVVIGAICFSIFVRPLQEEFGWQRGEIAIALTLTTFVQAIINPFFGVLLDRWGVRRLLLPSIVLLAALVASASLMTASLLHLYLIYLLIPVLGVGTGTIAYSRLLVSWFDRRRGLAIGIGLSGTGLGAMLVSPLLQLVVAEYGWREAYLVYAGLVLVISLPIALLLVRDSPAAVGIPPEERDVQPEGAAHGLADPGLSLKQAVATRQYRFMMIAYGLLGLGIGGVIAHLYPMMLDQGLSSGMAASAAGAMGAAMIVGRVSCGFLMDRFHAPYVAAAFLACPILGVALFAVGVDPTTAVIATITIGLGVGAEFDSIAYLVSRYFGIRNFGKVYGQIYGIFQVGHGIGPIALGVSHDRTGSYSDMLWVLMVLIAGAVVLTATLGQYRAVRPEEQTA